MKKQYSTYFISLLLWPGLLLAQPPAIQTAAVIQPTPLTVQQFTEKAKQWGLRIVDYQHYRTLMQQPQNQQWYRTLDPAEVLALNSDNDTDRLRYAKIEAQQMHRRIQRELAFDRAYRQAYHMLYPHEQPIQTTTGTMMATLQPSDRLWLFVNQQNRLPQPVLKKLLEIVTAHGAVLDIYVTGQSMNPQQLQNWALLHHIPNTLIHRTVTLNLGSTRWAVVHQHQPTARLPFLAWLHDQQLQPINWQVLDEK